MNKILFTIVAFTILLLEITFVFSETYDCTDSDSGKNKYVKGTTVGWFADYSQESTLNDKCFAGEKVAEIEPERNTNASYVLEFFCDDIGVFHSTYLECSNACQDGACVEEQKLECIDTDERNYFTRGYITGKDTNGYSYDNQPDICLNVPSPQGDEVYSSNYLGEFYCDAGLVNVEIYTCPMGCVNSVCSEKAEIIPNETADPVQVNDSFDCNGCISDKKCYSFGHRSKGKFCSDLNNQFIEQKKPDVSCENNFECSSNVCISGKCISEGFIQKLLNWFKRLF